MDFAEFWSQYPRKVAKKDAQKAWNKLTDEQKAKAISAIPSHKKMWAAECRLIQFTPYPASWLNGERFEDEIQMPEQQTPWWTTDEGTMEYGRKLGIPAAPGMGMAEYRAKLRVAA